MLSDTWPQPVYVVSHYLHLSLSLKSWKADWRKAKLVGSGSIRTMEMSDEQRMNGGYHVARSFRRDIGSSPTANQHPNPLTSAFLTNGSGQIPQIQKGFWAHWELDFVRLSIGVAVLPFSPLFYFYMIRILECVWFNFHFFYFGRSSFPCNINMIYHKFFFFLAFQAF